MESVFADFGNEFVEIAPEKQYVSKINGLVIDVQTKIFGMINADKRRKALMKKLHDKLEYYDDVETWDDATTFRAKVPEFTISKEPTYIDYNRRFLYERIMKTGTIFMVDAFITDEKKVAIHIAGIYKDKIKKMLSDLKLEKYVVAKAPLPIDGENTLYQYLLANIDGICKRNGIYYICDRIRNALLALSTDF